MNSEEMDEILMDDILEGLSPEQAPVDDLEDEAAEDSLIRLTDSKEKPREEQLDYPESLPYTTESLAQMDAKLELILRRLVDCVNAKDYDVGFVQWNHRLECWVSLKYPMKRQIRAKLVMLYYEIAVLPGMDARLIDVAASMGMALLESKKKIDINDLQLPWKPIYSVLEKELFPKQRKTGMTNISATLLNLTEFSRRLFPPHEISAMLKCFLPRIASNLNSILATQAFCTHFLPISHPQYYLPAVFKLWESFNSEIWDGQWLDMMSRMATKHLDPEESNPAIVEKLKKDAEKSFTREDEPVRSNSIVEDVEMDAGDWRGIRKDVGIFSDAEWGFIMTKCLRAMGVPVGGGSKLGGIAATDFAVSDASASGVVLTMKRPTEKLSSFASLIVYSMSQDSPASRSTPTGSNTPLDPNSKKQTYLAGSKALDSLAKLIQATESFFHPSNYGAWAPHLGRFLQTLTWEFHRRVKEEERDDCKTPQEWRITPDIRRHFVLTMRTVALLSMFSRDPLTIANSQSALKTMGILEPDLVFPAVLERAYPALETLLETHRTTASITALSTLAAPLISRSIYPAGAKNLVPLLELCLPGLDVNDPIKTMSTSMFVVSSVISIMVDDLTRPEVQTDVGLPVYEDPPPVVLEDGTEPALTRAEEDVALRNSTAGFPDFVAQFFRAVLVLFEALPEPGKGSRNGGKMEDVMTQTLIAACDFVCHALSPPLFDMALDILFNYVTSSIRSNSVRVISQLTSCFARANSAKTLAKFLRPCSVNIRAEIESGAGSTRTTSTQTAIESDTTLHWWVGLLTGALTNSGEGALVHKVELVSILKFMNEHCKSERAFTSAARIYANLLVTLTNVWPRDHRSVNKEEWDSEHFRKHHHETWGRLYEVKEVVIDWHVPSEDEINFAVELLKEIAVPALDTIDSLLKSSNGSNTSLEWTNDFCRNSNIVRGAMSGIPALVLLSPPTDLGQVASDAGDEVPEFIDHLPHCEAGICLTDPTDPRHQFVVQLRERTGKMLHEAVQSLKNNGAEDSIDSQKMIIASIRVLELDYPCDHSHYATVKKSYEFALQISRTTTNQKAFPRFVWIRRASLHHASRLRLNSFYRKRSSLDDLLIADMCDLSLSSYVQVRRAAQKGLDSMTHYFDGARSILFDRLFQALKPGTDHDAMKGALYVLGSKMLGNLAILDWRFGPRYLLALLECSHQERPSVQQLVKTITHDFVIRLAEPSTLKASVHSPALKNAADELEKLISIPVDADLLARVAAKSQGRVTHKNAAYDELVPKLLSLAKSPDTHWRYSLTATRFLRALVRRDQPLRADVSVYFSEQLISELPNQRTHSMLALTKTLHFMKLRTACGGSGEKLLLQQTSNPLRRKVVLEHPLPPNFTENFIESFSKPIDSDTLLMDKQSTGWLVWGDSVEFYAVPPETDSAITWDVSSAEALEQIRAVIMTAAWWGTFTNQLSQEKSVDYLASDATTIVKSIFQIFEDAPCEFVLPILDGFIAEKTNRHKQRAAGELLGGMIRGSKHWPLVKQKLIWDWVTPLLPSIFEGVTPETETSWQMFCDYVLNSRDPRRNKPLVDYLTTLTIDPESSAAFSTAKSQDLVGSAMKSLGWHFSPWAPKYIEMYMQHLDHPFGEVRGAVADNLRHLSELRLHPSYSSVDAFMRECKESTGRLMNVDAAYEAQIDQFAAKLVAWRQNRQSSSQGTQSYDKAALTILTWIWSSVSDFRISAAFPFITKLLPEFFRMQEMLDNDELRLSATRVVIAAACLPFPADLAGPLMRQFLDLLKSSDSWRIRVEILLPLQMFYFHNLFNLDQEIVAELMDAICGLLRDPKIEVREAAATTLSGIVRCSQRSSILTLRDRFMAVIRTTKIPKRRNAAGEEVAEYQDALAQAHSAVLGITSLINAFPYEVPKFVPEILIETMSKHATSPVPISTAVKACLADFKRSHADSWAEDQKVFSEEQQLALHDLLSGSSYYA